MYADRSTQDSNVPQISGIFQAFICLLLLSAYHIYAQTPKIDSVTEVIDNAVWQTTVTKYYDPAYVGLKYPGGDVAIDRGVCTDVIIRAFRSVGIDFQKLIHDDMLQAFNAYPRYWGLKRPDPNIDHRRVPNIQTYLSRHNKSLPLTQNGKDYLPGDIVTWMLPGEIDHIGIVSNVPVENRDRFGIVHNIGRGAELEDVLFVFKITGHYRYFTKG